MPHNEELHKLYSSPNIRFGRADKEEWDVRDIQQARWEGEVHTGLWWEKAKREHLEDSDVDGRIILKLIFDRFEKGSGLY